jgi:hypothetical protein
VLQISPAQALDQRMYTFSQHDRPCVDMRQDWCNVPKKLQVSLPTDTPSTNSYIHPFSLSHLYSLGLPSK